MISEGKFFLAKNTAKAVLLAVIIWQPRGIKVSLDKRSVIAVESTTRTLITKGIPFTIHYPSFA